MHNSIIEQINSYIPIISKLDGNDYVTINKKKKDYLVPKIPKPFTNPELVTVFVEDLKKSKFFIS